MTFPLEGDDGVTSSTSAEVEGDLTFSHIPKILRGCLHTICQNCAEDALQRSGISSSIKCPLCGLTTSDVISTSALQDDVVALQDIRRNNSYCDFCDDDTVQASHLCKECESLLCKFHVEAHAISRGTKSHIVVSLDDNGFEISTSGILHHVPIMCARHKGVPAKIFCSEPCGTTICHDCSVTEHSGHSVHLADSEEVELSHRTGLSCRRITLGHRLAKVKGALDAVKSAKTGVEQQTRIAENSASQVFSSLRAAVDSREKAVLENLRADGAGKMQDLNSQIESLCRTVDAYEVALEATDKSLKNLRGNQLLAMEPTLRDCLDKHEKNFLSQELEPCVEDCVGFEHDRDIAAALRLGISRVGYIVQDEPDIRNPTAHNKEKPRSSAREDHKKSVKTNQTIHFTVAANVGARPRDLSFTTPTDVVVVEIRDGSEHEFLKHGKPGPMIGKVALRTRVTCSKHLTYESRHFFESLSQQVEPKRKQRKQQQRETQQLGFPSYYGTHDIPTVRFTKTLRISGRRRRVESIQSSV